MKDLDKLLTRKKLKRPYGIFLSGGLDSAILANLYTPDTAISLGYESEGDKYCELEYAVAVAKNIGIQDHIIIKPERKDVRQDFMNAVNAVGRPINSISLYSWYKAMERAKDTGIKTWIGGEGADELFGGYTRYIILSIVNALYNTAELANYKPMLDKLFGSVNDLHEKLVDKKAPEFTKHNLIRHIGKWEFENTLPDIVFMEKQLAKHFGLELVLPFMDKEVKKFALRIPEELRVDGTVTKSFLRDFAVKECGLPFDIVYRQSKMGFVSPILKWLNLEQNYEFDKSKYLKYQREILCLENQPEQKPKK